MAEQAAKPSNWRDAPELVGTLKNALRQFDFDAADRICGDLVNRLMNAVDVFPEDPARQILAALRRKRRFKTMEAVGDALIRNGQSAPQIRRQYAQAMIDQGNLTAPEWELKSLADDVAVPVSERAEAKGLLGRIYKQLYINAAAPQNPRQQANLRSAIGYYWDVYKSAPAMYPWQGINTVALLARCARDEARIEPVADIEKTAGQILSDLNPDMPHWDRATAVEACIAIGDYDAAREHLLYFVQSDTADAFEVASLLRQLTEVWQLNTDSEPGKSLLPLLRAALLTREGGQVELTRHDIQSGLEAVFGTDRYEPLAWLQTALKRCNGIARIEDLMGRKVGTGFLLDPADFLSEPVGAPLLLTNHHVVSRADNPFPHSVTVDNAMAVFEALGETHRVKRLLWTSPVPKLDASLVTLENVGSGAACCPLKPPPAEFDGSGKQRVYVIGYPLGGGLSVSLQDSYWVDADGTFLRYRTPTEPGSSGSPVFDQTNWTVIGLHHKGKENLPRLKNQTGTEDANEAISVKAIREAIRIEGVRVAAV